MAPIEPDTTNSNFPPLAFFSTYLLITSGLTAIVTGVLHHAYTLLPPSQATRFRESNRRKHARAFVGLAVISALFAWYHLFSYCWLSYKIWASQRGVVIPRHLWSGHGLELGRWMKDTALLRDIWDVSLQKNRHFWWSQQKLLTASAWSVFLGAEGRRRNIPYLWAFVLLSQVVSLAFAQNLFFLAILLIPLPLPDSSHLLSSPIHSPSPRRSSVTTRGAGVLKKSEVAALRAGQSLFGRIQQLLERCFPPKPRNWTPHPAVSTLPLIFIYASIFLVSFTAPSSLSYPFLVIPHVLLYLPSLLPSLVPESWGSNHMTSKAAHGVYFAIFKFICWASLLLHLKQTLFTLLDNKPHQPTHQYSSLLFFQSPWQDDEQASAFGRYAIAFHRILRSLGDHPALGAIGWDVILCAVSLAVWAAIRGLDSEDLLEVTGLWKRGAVEAIQHEGKKLIERSEEKLSPKATPPKRTRGRPGKGSTTTVSPTSASISSPTTRRGSKLSTRDEDDEAAEAEDHSGTYVARGHEEDPRSSLIEGEEEVEEDLESGALAWAMAAVLGVGAGAACVFGAEMVGR